MKKYFILPLMAMSLMTFTACGDDETEIKGGDNGGDGPVVPIVDDKFNDKSGDGTGAISSNAMAVSAQQKNLEEIGKEALTYVSALDFEYWKQLAEYMDDHYFDGDFDSDVVENYFEDFIESTKLGTSTEEEHYSWSDYYYTYTDYRKLIVLSNLKARFTAGSRGWSKENANGLEFVFNDQNGNQCVATLTTSGSSKTVHVMDDNDWGNYRSDYDSNTDKYISYEEVDRNKFYVSVPENINVVVKVAGKERVKIMANINLGSIEKESIDLSKTTFEGSVTAVLDEYSFQTTNTKYVPNSSVTSSFTMAKSGKVLLTAQCNVSDFKLNGVSGDIADEDTWDDIEDDADVVGGKASFRVNVINKLQINGVLTNIQSFVDAARDIDRYDEDESKFKNAVNRMNNVAKVGVYYDGKPEKQAEFAFKAFEDRYDSYWGSESYWECEPVVVFADGSSYSLIEENNFFNEKAFKSLIDAFENLCDDFEELLDD